MDEVLEKQKRYNIFNDIYVMENSYNTLLIDGPYLYHRSANVPYKLTNSSGVDTTSLHSFFVSINALRKKFNPDEIIVTWESHGTPSWRKKISSKYKLNYESNVDPIQLKDIQYLLHLFGVPQYYAPENEADDVIASLKESSKGCIVIFTIDKDIMQLVDDNTHIWNGKKLFKIKDVKEKFLVEPKEIPDLLAICGDNVDNIIGIKGYGPKKSAKIINKYGSIEKFIKEEKCNFPFRLSMNKSLTLLNNKCKVKKLYEIVFSDDVRNENINKMLRMYGLNTIEKNLDEFLLLGKCLKKP